MSTRAPAIKFLVFLVLVLWLVYIYVLGEELFSEIYKDSCQQVTVPLDVWAFMTGCVSFTIFIIYRVLAGFSPFAALKKPTDYTRLCYVAHTMAAFICLFSTELSFTTQKTAQCSTFEPSLLPMFLASVINVVNGFLSNEQFGFVLQPAILVTQPDALDIQIEGLIGERASNYMPVNVAPSTIPKTD